MIPWFEWKTFSLGPLTLQVWGLFVALGMLVSIFILLKRAKKLDVNGDSLFNMAFYMIVSGIFFSRLFHIVFYEPGLYWHHPSEIIKIWHGGLSSFGGIFGAMVAFVWLIKKYHLKEKLFLVSDALCFSAVFGWILGRIGCFMIHDHLGAHSNCPLAMQTSDGPRLEMALLEILGMLPLALLFFFTRQKQKPAGWYTGLLFAYYGVLRFILDFFRAEDIVGADTRYLGLTPAQYFAIVLVLWGGFLFKNSLKK